MSQSNKNSSKTDNSRLKSNSNNNTKFGNQTLNIHKSPPLEIYCRLRPKNLDSLLCLKIISSSTLKLIQPEFAYANNFDCLKQNYYNFKSIFDENSNHIEIYKKIGFPMVKNLIKGQNSLFFAYGQSGSGKTYTMNGDYINFGLIPRCMNTIFQNILNYQSEKLCFRQDKTNEYHLLQRNENSNETKNKKSFHRALKFDEFIDDELAIIDQNNIYALFINYVEIYNNSVYDLLDGKGINKWQNKPIREDNHHRVFIHGIKEIEVKTIDEALEIFYKAQKQRKTEPTALHTESNRSHTILTLKLLKATNFEKKQNLKLQNIDYTNISVSQLCFVDLAGGERTTRTKNTGQRLREAGNINNSLMTLRYCLEVLRDNQLNSGQKMIPYRDSKLTHLFKNYFEGDGAVCLLVCINPSRENYDDTFKILKFSGDVQINRSPSIKLSPILLKRRISKQNLIEDEKEGKNNFNYSVEKLFEMKSNSSNDNLVNNKNSSRPEYVIKDLMKFLENRVRKKQPIARENNRSFIEKEYSSIKEENLRLIDMIEDEKNKNRHLESDNHILNENIQHYLHQINELQNLLNLEKSKYSQLENESRYQEYQFNNLVEEEKVKIFNLEKVAREYEIEIQELNVRFIEMREMNEKLQQEFNLNVEKYKTKIHRKDMLLNDLNKQLIEAKHLEKMNKKFKSRKFGRFIRSAENLKFERTSTPQEPSGVTGIFIKQKTNKIHKENTKSEEIKLSRPKTINGAAIRRREKLTNSHFF